MKTKVSTLVAVLVVAFCATVFAGERLHEGKITNIDLTQKTLTVQGEKGDSATFIWTETTKLKDGLIIQELKTGDSVHFDYIDKDGQKMLTELRRTKSAPKS